MSAQTRMVRTCGVLQDTFLISATKTGTGYSFHPDKHAFSTLLIRLKAARAALRRKKQHEHTLEQTTAQISTLEQQIYSIEAANINRETLAAMERAGKAMQTIHGKLNIDKVDETMYAVALVLREYGCNVLITLE